MSGCKLPCPANLPKASKPVHLLPSNKPPPDVYSDRRLPEAARRHEVALGECLGGALYVNDFLSLCKQASRADLTWSAVNPAASEGPATRGVLDLGGRCAEAVLALTSKAESTTVHFKTAPYLCKLHCKLSQVGFSDPRVLAAEPIEVHDAELEGVLGGAKFYSVTFRWADEHECMHVPPCTDA